MGHDPEKDGATRRPSGRRSAARAVVLALGAAALYGGWAVHANASSGRAVRAGLAQAMLSFTSTLTLTLLLEWLFRLGRTPDRGFVLSATGTVILMTIYMVTLHAIVGTPRILLTIAPSVAFGAVFYSVYAWGLRVAAKRSR